MVILCIFCKVSFIGENGTDGGGLTREFFTIFGKDLARKYIETTGTFRHNAMALQARLFVINYIANYCIVLLGRCVFQVRTNRRYGFHSRWCRITCVWKKCFQLYIRVQNC